MGVMLMCLVTFLGSFTAEQHGDEAIDKKTGKSCAKTSGVPAATLGASPACVSIKSGELAAVQNIRSERPRIPERDRDSRGARESRMS